MQEGREGPASSLRKPRRLKADGRRPFQRTDKIPFHQGLGFMADENARQKAEDHYYAALDLVAEGEQERALAEYELSLAADPVFTEAMHGMARTLQNLDRLDEAIAVAKQIAELDPDDVLAYTSLSVLYQKKGMIPEAEAEANKARILSWKQQLKKH
jgi:tetratricopeptide (TPR) repeat protein